MNPIDWHGIIKASSGSIRRLSSVWRFSSIPISTPENVGEHTYWVALYAAMIHLHVDVDGEELLGPIVLHALIHDSTESSSGDYVRTHKYKYPKLKEQLDLAEEDIKNSFPDEIKNIFAYLDIKMKHSDNKVSDYIKTVVKAADFLSLFQFMRREALRGNLEIYPFFNKMMKDITKMRENPHLQEAFSNGFIASHFYNDLLSQALKIKNVCFECLGPELVNIAGDAID